MSIYQPSCFDESERLTALSQLRDPLEERSRYIDFDLFRPELAAVFARSAEPTSNAVRGGHIGLGIAPLRYRVLAPRLTLRAVKWHRTEPEEDFSFFDLRLLHDAAPPLAGLIYLSASALLLPLVLKKAGYHMLAYE